MEWITIALDVITKQKEIIENQKIIMARLDEFGDKLKKLGQSIDEQTLVEFRSGMKHLYAGHNSDLDEIRNEEFRMARSIFNKLISLNPETSTEGTSYKIKNTYLICMGYWGSFQYFSLRGDYRNALLHAYEGIMKFPGISMLELDLFPSGLFSKDYSTLIRETTANIAALIDRLEKEKDENFKKKLSHYTKHGARILASGAAGAGAAAIATLFTGGALSTSAFTVVASGVYKSIKVGDLRVADIETINKELKNQNEKLHTLEADLNEECENRLDELQKVKPAYFKKLEARIKSG